MSLKDAARPDRTVSKKDAMAARLAVANRPGTLDQDRAWVGDSASFIPDRAKTYSEGADLAGAHQYTGTERARFAAAIEHHVGDGPVDVFWPFPTRDGFAVE